MAHKCHGKTYFLTAKLTFSRQNLLSHGKTYFLAANLTFSRQYLLSYGNVIFFTLKLHIFTISLSDGERVINMADAEDNVDDFL